MTVEIDLKTKSDEYDDMAGKPVIDNAPTGETTPEDFEKEQEHRQEILKAGSWDKDALLHHDDPNAPPKAQAEGENESPSRPSLLQRAHNRFSLRNLVRHPDDPPVTPADWGLPGELTQSEVDVFIEFQTIVETRGGAFRDTVYCFGEEEGEPWTLCRWLRARKFNLDDTVKMVEEATEERAEARKHDFYPDPKEALGTDPSLFTAQYPQLYTGNAKNGCPVFISKPGVLSVGGVECITTMDGILRYHWYVMMHDFAGRLHAAKKADPNFTRFECFCVLDLDHLTSAQLSQVALNIIQKQSKIDSLCFPETMNKMIIVNAPRFFSITWKLIKGWLDPRTAGKIELFSSRAAGEKKLLEFIDADQLPSDYGGNAEATTSILERESKEQSGMKRRILELMLVRAHSSFPVELHDNEAMEIIIYTRSTSGAKFEITDSNKKSVKKGVEIVHVSNGTTEKDNEPPTSITLIDKLLGPGKFKIRADSKSGRFSSDNFFIVCNIQNTSG